MAHAPSPFLDPGSHASANCLGILQLRRDQLIPAVLSPHAESDYAEGKVENTRFGSFPHSTLVGQPWGTQILASVVDTGSRGKSKKRKRDAKEEEVEESPKPEGKEAKKDIVKAAAASSGFAHLVPPTPETWTLSLPHRTQVVYTPDYSYILQRLRVRPGDHIIEAGAGSGSFTHASVRAVYNGYPGQESASNGTEDADQGAVGITKKTKRSTRRGAVYSFEYHEPRARQLQVEIKEHGLAPLVTVTHRDVYADGFCLENTATTTNPPDADAIFLDLPAPGKPSNTSPAHPSPPPPLNPSHPTPPPQQSPPQTPNPYPHPSIRICTFSPCIEQVTKTVAALRTLGWLEIDMVEISAKRLEVRRERIGLAEEGVRGGIASAASVDEAVQRLREVEGRAAVFHGLQRERQVEVMKGAEARKRGDAKGESSRLDQAERARREGEGRALFKEGRLVHRTEGELKTHTSYLVFAVLPREWSAEDEEKARRKWG
ncbi:S-adenosyl-L-methionine-dependent methyltransferase [Phaeosphaeriaceae sp. PMI808]|nr:S-adenosyl-L-methionine-dependent methyltransferase [Phaeosphaeriaceae sp. PMI808]